MIFIFYIMLIVGLFATGKKSIKAMRAGDSKDATKWGVFVLALVLIGILVKWIVSKIAANDSNLRLANAQSSKEIADPSIGTTDNYTFLEETGVFHLDMGIKIPKGTRVLGKVIKVNIHPLSGYSNPPRLQKTIEFTYDGMTLNTTNDKVISDTQKIQMTI